MKRLQYETTGEGARGDALNQKWLLDHLKSCE
jgi:hypothetical protein